MSDRNMRYEITNCPKYKTSTSWKERVKRMPEDQVLAIWLRFKKEGVC